jgi:methyl-accepting chemotaxis protein
MNAVINSNAEKAKHTYQSAIQSATMVDEGEQAVTETVQVMREIIAKINVIEDIAEQTNMLALTPPWRPPGPATMAEGLP